MNAPPIMPIVKQAPPGQVGPIVEPVDPLPLRATAVPSPAPYGTDAPVGKAGTINSTIAQKVVPVKPMLVALDNLPTQFFIASSACSGVAVQMSAVSVKFRRGFFYGYKTAAGGGAPVNNSNNVNIGTGYQRGVGASSTLLDTITPGAWVEYDAPDGLSYDLMDFFQLGQPGDSVFARLTLLIATPVRP